MVDNDAENTTDSPLMAIGRRLTKAREDAGMDLCEIASELHLRAEIIQALEAGDEAVLPAAAFIRGYIRSYARCVGLDDAALVAGLPQATEHRPVARSGSQVRYRAPSVPLGRVLVWGLVLLILALVVRYGAPAVERLWSGEDNQAIDNTLQLPRSEFGSPDEDTLALPKSSEVPPVIGTVAGSLQGGSASAPVAPRPAPVSNETLPSELTLRFTQDSWVEMTSRDRKLMLGTQRAGSERTVRAEPPINILLGNASGVKMSWRGKPFDITPYQRGKVARIKLER